MLDFVEQLRATGLDAGLDAIGVAPAEPFLATRHHLEARRADGLHGGMQFTYRNPARSTDPAATLPGARALVVGARAYHRAVPDRPAGGPMARVARYVWEDHYDALRVALGVIAEQLEQNGWRTAVLVDDNALVDREAAYRAGLGWYGKSTNLLLRGRGSWFVLGSVLTDAPLPASRAPVGDGCGACTRCIDACPTGAIVAPGVVDARRCLAWLVQAPGSFPEELRTALGDRLYGCDDCQEVCPPNRRSSAEEGEANQAWVPLLDLLRADDGTLLDRHGRWYIPQREPRYLRRNALVVLGNVGDASDPEVADTVRRYVHDPDPMLREHAAWAAERLGVDMQEA